LTLEKLFFIRGQARRTGRGKARRIGRGRTKRIERGTFERSNRCGLDGCSVWQTTSQSSKKSFGKNRRYKIFEKDKKRSDKSTNME